MQTPLLHSQMLQGQVLQWQDVQMWHSCTAAAATLSQPARRRPLQGLQRLRRAASVLMSMHSSQGSSTDMHLPVF